MGTVTARLRAENGRLRSELARLNDRLAAEQATRTGSGLFRTLLNSTPATITMRDREGRFLFVNDAAAELMARIDGQRHDYIGRRFSDVHEASPGSSVEDLVMQVLASGSPIIDREIEPPLFPGTVQRYTIAPVKFGDDTILGTFTIGQDITEAKRIETALRESEQRFRRLIDNSNQGIMVHRRQKVLYVNQAFVSLFGYDSQDEVLALDSTQILIEPEYWRPEIQEQIGDGRFHTLSMEHEAVRKNGSRVWVSAHSFAIDWQGEPAICTARTDITERRRADELIARQRDELVVLNRHKDRFFSIVAHDLKSPFTALLGMTQVMARAPLELSRERLAEYAFDVNKAGNQVFDLLLNLLEWARLQMSGADIAPRQVALRELVEDCRTVLAPSAQEKRIAIRNKIRRTQVYGDPDMLRTVFRNLIANAVKFTADGGEICLSARRKGKEVRITVSDNGVGMSDEQIAEVFSIDRKTTTVGTALEQGTGLGLPLCRDLVACNSGRIWIESLPGQGTSIHLAMPAMAPGPGPNRQQAFPTVASPPPPRRRARSRTMR